MFRRTLAVAVLLSIGFHASRLFAHPHHTAGRKAPTFEISAPAQFGANDRFITVRIVDTASGKPTAARLLFTVDGKRFTPTRVDAGGIRFVSIHTAKKQRATIIYSRGQENVRVGVPNEAKRVELIAIKGYEHLPARATISLESNPSTVIVRMQRWSDVREDGWAPADEHLHYERLVPEADADWFTMLSAEGLTHAHFMVLKGGNLPGVWAQQYAYGSKGVASEGSRLLVPGEEFRDRRQGHINLLGLGSIIQPISIGGLGKPATPYNYPALFDVLNEARSTGGVGGPAHGGALAAQSTSLVDTILGANDFFEIANTHLYKTDVWYHLMNCGFLTPPAAGTDLPNFPFRDDWQPLLGETRMYLQVGGDPSFRAWKSALRSGRVFISSGPIIRLKVNGVGPGGVIQLPDGGGDVNISAELSATQPLQSLELLRNASPVALSLQDGSAKGVFRLAASGKVRIHRSCWLAARGTGAPKRALRAATGIQQNAIAHTAAIRVIVGGQPITSVPDAKWILSKLQTSQEAYRNDGRFETPAHRARMLQLFDRAIQKIEEQISE